MKKQGRLILVIVLLLIVVIFSWLNVRNVTVSFGFTKVTMPLVILLVLAILIGAINCSFFVRFNDHVSKKENQ